MDDGTKRRFYAAGDPNQNLPIEFLSLSRLERKAYYFDAVTSIFDMQIELKVCKRVKTEEERAMLNEIRDLTLHTDTPLIDIARRFFKPISSLEVLDGLNVCYLNETALLINLYCNAREAASMDPSLVLKDGRLCYWVGQELRCRSSLARGIGCFINYVYTVSEISAEGVTLRSTVGDVLVVTCAELREWFSFQYAATCHSLQGSSVAKRIYLHDLLFFYVTREWFYTALTRARNLYEIYYWEPSVVLHDLQVVADDALARRIEKKLESHRAADLKVGRSWVEADYLTVEDVRALLSEQENRCSECGEVVELAWKSASDPSQFTIDRLNNDLAHIRGNCVISCLSCNRATH
jgi:hypothetical protein